MGRGRGGCQRGVTYCDCRYHRNERSRIQREINEDRSADGRWTNNEGTAHTVNSSDDVKVPEGGYYHNQHGPDDHATAVYNPDDTLADVRANRDWQDTPRQD